MQSCLKSPLPPLLSYIKHRNGRRGKPSSIFIDSILKNRRENEITNIFEKEVFGNVQTLTVSRYRTLADDISTSAGGWDFKDAYRSQVYQTH